MAPAPAAATVTHVLPVAADAGLAALLARAAAQGASDVVLSAGAPPAMRLRGAWSALSTASLSSEQLLAFFEPLLGSRRPLFDRTGSVDLAVSIPSPDGDEPGVRLRVNLFRHANGVAAAVRPIWSAVPTLEALHLPPALLELVRPGSGLVLLTGPTGAGKSTTLAALLDHLNRSRAGHIVTLEDPIEYLYRPRLAIVHQREVGRDVDSFESGLRAALRENPDVLLVGEMRDPQTIRLALTAAETGHLVLSTLHSGSAAMAIERVLDAFTDSEKLFVRQQLAGVLRAVVAQQLLPAVGGGLHPVLEILTVNHAVAAQIREGRTHMLATQMEIGAVEGMVPFARALAELVRAGRVSRAAALAARQRIPKRRTRRRSGWPARVDYPPRDHRTALSFPLLRRNRTARRGGPEGRRRRSGDLLSHRSRHLGRASMTPPAPPPAACGCFGAPNCRATSAGGRYTCCCWGYSPARAWTSCRWR